jgi:hypothetical protein
MDLDGCAVRNGLIIEKVTIAAPAADLNLKDGATTLESRFTNSCEGEKISTSTSNYKTIYDLCTSNSNQDKKGLYKENNGVERFKIYGGPSNLILDEKDFLHDKKERRSSSNILKASFDK